MIELSLEYCRGLSLGYFVTGFLLALIFDFPAGIVGLFILKRFLDEEIRYALSLALIASFFDFIIPLLFLIGFSLISLNPYIRITGMGIAFVLLALLILKGKNGSVYENKRGNFPLDASFIVLAYFSNPSPIILWFNLAGLLRSNFKELSVFSNQVILSMGVGLGSFFFQTFALYLASKAKRKISGSAFLHKFSEAVLYLVLVLVFANLLKELIAVF